MRFSILIPLEFHRGLAEQCIRGWSVEQSYSRDDFEIIVAAPEDHDAGELQRIERLLGPQDRILRLPHTHDMPLVACAATEARGEFLVFTEAHCLPESDFLEQANLVLDEHGDWAGFSCRSIPITHNLLSEIEAEMYNGDIARNMHMHPWLKVLDQCFVVRVQAYAAVGGIEPGFGHFAEWLIAARFHRHGLKIGYDDRPAIRHYYVGDLHDLEEFTIDFSAGQMRFAQAAATDPCGDLFDEVPAWRDRYETDPRVAARLLRQLAVDLVQQLRLNDGKSAWTRMQAWPWAHAAKWLARRLLTVRIRLALRRAEQVYRRMVVQLQLIRKDHVRAAKAFQQLMSVCVQRGHAQVLREWICSRTDPDFAPQTDVSEWRPGLFEGAPAAGFYGLETRDRLPFRWSQPSATVGLPALSGDSVVRIEWAGFTPLSNRNSARFYYDGAPIPSERISHLGDQTILSLPGSGKPASLSWVCDPFPSSLDSRKLGLPVSCVSWRKSLASVETRHHTTDAVANRPLYFLHVPKCAGTMARYVLTDPHPSEALLAPHVDFYYARELEHRPEVHQPCALACGHFGWELPRVAAERDWRIVTLLRDPYQRIRSLWDYIRQHNRVPRDMSFDNWLEHEILLKETFLANFASGLMLRHEQGAASIARILDAHRSIAIANLERCEVVGLQEQMDDSLNLLCAATDSLPPLQTPRVNVTLNRTPVSAAGSKTTDLFNRFFGSEQVLYARGQALFQRQLTELHSSLAIQEGHPLDTAGVRRCLRRRFFERQSSVLSGHDFADELHWETSDPFIGQNLHNREFRAGQSLRWTGPSTNTYFYFPVDASRRSEIMFRLHPASPQPHVAAARLQVNGQEVPLDHAWTGTSFTLRGTFMPTPPSPDHGEFSEFKLIVPTKRGQGEFRELGVALLGIEVSAAAVVISFPQTAQQVRRAA